MFIFISALFDGPMGYMGFALGFTYRLAHYLAAHGDAFLNAAFPGIDLPGINIPPHPEAANFYNQHQGPQNH